MGQGGSRYFDVRPEIAREVWSPDMRCPDLSQCEVPGSPDPFPGAGFSSRVVLLYVQGPGPPEAEN
eukprot:1925007-Pyramimonas_sp.AAC.1